jgi:diguanylate cyclase (GGDEF)-like protein
MTLMYRSLRNRFLLSLCGVLLLALAALALVARFQVMPILLEDEEAFASAELDRVERALAGERNHMRRLVEDWAHWDDTYDFVHGVRPEYVDSNLYQSTLETLELEMMLFLDRDKQPHWIVGFDETGKFTSCPDLLPPCDWAESAVSLLGRYIGNDADGEPQIWLLAEPGLALGGISPIHQSREDSPPGGWLGMIRPLDEPWLAQLRDTTGIALELTGTLAQPGSGLELARTSSTHMAASRLVPALPSSHAVRIDTELPRQRYQASLETFRFALYWTGGVLVVTLLVVLWLLERMVLQPLREFAHYTQRLHHDTEHPSIPDALVARQDEIGTLAREFRSLLQHQRRQSEQLVELTLHDPLTGVANRRLFDERLVAALSRDDSRQPTATMMIDIDHFKLYNDHYGHQAGDACLIALARCMNQRLASQGFLLARTGGEEFSVLLPDSPLDTALEHARDLLQAINELSLPHDFSPTAPNVTVSIGVAVQQDNLVSPSDIMSAADRAMYQAKASGRNRVVAYRRQNESQPVA